ncbi:MAG: DUF1987 domain-containing protein [Proteobacteria bacterium]|nr:DUF1987 domain-containing protein [Pseudomonadota bacterium]MBU1611022.1 DUF1987 domain-containing protein [Pseudomonadota bacterium]
MDELYIEATKSSPLVKFDPKNNVLEIVGESYPENAVKFYAPMFEWLNNNLGHLNSQPLTVNLNVSYFNSSSSKALMNLFDVLEETFQKVGKITVNWLYLGENETAQECGEEFQEDLEFLPFNLVKIENG